MKSAGIVRISSVSNIRKVTQYNEKEQKISGTWGDQEHVYTPDELCTYQGAALNGGDNLHDQGNAFIQNGINNQRLYRLKHPLVSHELTSARTFIQSFDYRLNPQLTPEDVHEIGTMFSDELHHYFQDYGVPIHDSLISTHLDRSQPKLSPYNERTLQPHLHNHIMLHAYTPQGEPLSRYLQKTNLHDFQDINDRVTERFDLHDYYFAKLQHLVYPMSAKTDYRTQWGDRSLSHLGLACQRFLNANQMAFQKHPNDFNQSLRYRDRLLRYNFNYRTKQRADLRHGTSNQVFTMGDFRDDQHRPIWYNTRNLRVLQWHSPEDAQVEHLITHLDFNHANELTPTHREYRKTMQYAIQANDQAQHMEKHQPRLKMRAQDHPNDTQKQPDLSSHVHFSESSHGQHKYLISLRSIFARVRREEEKIKKAASRYRQRIEVQIEHVKARMEQRRKERAQMRGEWTHRHREVPNYRENELYQYMTLYSEDRHGKVQSHRVKRSLHPQSEQESRSDQRRKEAQRRRARLNQARNRPHWHF